MTAEPTTKLARNENVLREGYAGLGTGARGLTFAPGHLFLTDRRLLVESRLETDRTTVIYALSAIEAVTPLDDGFRLHLAEGQVETVIVWGDAAAWLDAVEEARITAPPLPMTVREVAQRDPIQKRRRTVVYGAVGVVIGAILLIVVCIAAFVLWATLGGG